MRLCYLLFYTRDIESTYSHLGGGYVLFMYLHDYIRDSLQLKLIGHKGTRLQSRRSLPSFKPREAGYKLVYCGINSTRPS